MTEEEKKKNQSWKTDQDGLDKIRLEEGDVPSPGEGEVLVKISAVSLNYRDVEVCNGFVNRGLPHTKQPSSTTSITPCSAMCGIVTATNSPRRWKVGDRVLSLLHQGHLTGPIGEEEHRTTELGLPPLDGVLTRYRVFSVDGLVRPPGYLDHGEAASLSTAAVTAWMCVNQFRPLGEYLDYSGEKEKTKKRKDGDGDGDDGDRPTMLLQGTGNVAIAGLQIAHAAGFRTIITSASDEELLRAKDLGADLSINYRTHWEWEGQVLEATAGRGAAFVLESGGPYSLRKSFGCVAFGGVISCVGNDGPGPSGGGKDASPELSGLSVSALALKRNVTLKGVMNGPRDRVEELLGFYEEKKIKPVVDKVFGFEQVKEAFAYLVKESRFGAVVIQVGEENEE